MLEGSTLHDMELSCGKLHFTRALQLKRLTVYVLDKEDLLRLKVISIDTNIIANSLGGDFTRYKDFNDIKLLMADLGYSMDDVKEITKGRVEDARTYDVIQDYLNKGLESAMNDIESITSEGTGDLEDILANEQETLSSDDLWKSFYAALEKPVPKGPSSGLQPEGKEPD
jgi:hypothetical protein